MSTITLDYDEVSKDFVLNDTESLLANELPDKTEMRIRESSANHFHVEFTTAVDIAFADCVAFARKSKCSKDYIDRVEKIGYFAIRKTKKSDRTPKPKTIMAVVNGGTENGQ